MNGSWLWTEDSVKDTPSFQQGMTKEEEARCRREGCKIFLEVGAVLKLKANPTLATAGVYFHRFYMFHSFQEFDKELTALGCIFLAGKVEETPKKCKDICYTAQLKFPNLYNGKYKHLVDEVMGIERVLLQTIKFDLQVDQPYKFLLDYVKAIPQQTGSEVTRQMLVQTAWTFVNDSIHTNICLLWEPQVIAVALIHLALTVKQINPECYPANWWDKFVSNLPQNLIDNVCHRVLDFYTVSREDSDRVKSSEPPANKS